MRSLFGKLLSMNVATKGVRIEALGLRNAWRFSFDRANGDLYIGDVGQGELEEIDYTPASSPGLENYGWDVYEGSEKFEDKSPGPGKLVFPIAEYSTTTAARSPAASSTAARTRRCAGRYIYGDYCSGNVWSLAVKDGKATRPAARGLQARQPDLVRRGRGRRALRRVAPRRGLPPDAVTHFVCVTCAAPFADSETPPERCPICEDERQYVGPGGQRWTTLEELRAEGRLRGARRLRLSRRRNRARLAIGQRLLLAETEEGNVIWDIIP